MIRCPLDEHQLWHILHALDDPDRLEFPAGYNHRRVRERFEQLARRLDTDFGCQCRVDRDVQGASLHGRIDLPAAATVSGRPLVVRISNFGGLAVLAIDNPGVHSDTEAARLLHPDDAHRIQTALASLGYTLIPEEPLWQPYDGAWDPAVFAPGPATWWTRYFDYV
jgi:hypothetical protein